MPLTARCHSLRPDKSTGWLAYFELAPRGSRSGHFLVVGPAAVHRAEDVQTALRAGQAAVRYLKEVPGHAPPVTLLEATARILAHESKKTGTVLEFGCAVLDADEMWLLTRGDVRLVPLAPVPGTPFGAVKPHGVSASAEDRYFLGRIPKDVDGQPVSADFRSRLEHGEWGHGGLVIHLVPRDILHEVEPPTPRKPKPRRTPGFTAVLRELQHTLDFEPSSEETPSIERVETIEPRGSTGPAATEASAPEKIETDATTPEPTGTDDAPAAGSGAEPPAKAAPVPEESATPVEEELEPDSRPIPDPDEASPGDAEPEPTPEPERAESGADDPEAPEPPGPADPAPAPEEPETAPAFIGTTVDLAPPEVRIYAPEETRGLGFWLAVVAAVAALGLLIAYLIFLRPQIRSEGGLQSASNAVSESLGVVAGPVRAVPLWEDRFTEAVTSSPVVIDDTVVFGCRDGRVYALGRIDGRRVWAYVATQGFGSSPMVAGGMVIIGGYDRNIYALDAASGKERWSIPTRGRIVASPAIGEDTAYIGSYDHNLYAVSVQEGEIRWQKDLGAVLWASPVAHENLVAAAGLDGRITMLDAATGRVHWHSQVGGAIYSSPAMDDERVYVGSQDGHLYAFHALTGKPAWSVDGGGQVNGSPAVIEGLVVVGTDAGRVIAVDAVSGEVRWTVETGGEVKCRPAISGRVLWVTGYDGFLHGIDWRAGEEIARIRTDSSAFSSPAIHEGVVYFGALDGRFLAYRLGNGT